MTAKQIKFVKRLFWHLGRVLVTIAMVNRWPLLLTVKCREVNKMRVNIWTVFQNHKSGC